MKITRFVAGAVLALLMAIPTLAQQDRKTASFGTRLFAVGTVGPAALGFRAPRMSGGGEIQQDVTRHFSIDAYFTGNGDVKAFSSKGHGINYGARLNIWLHPKFALHGGMASSTYWSAIPIATTPRPQGGVDTIYQDYKKGGNSPFVGFRVQTKILGGGGYLDVDYFIPTGCVWATEKNACPITSAREHAVVVSQTIQILKNFYFGPRIGWINYGDQVNPNAPEQGQARHNTRFAEMVLRYQVR